MILGISCFNNQPIGSPNTILENKPKQLFMEKFKMFIILENNTKRMQKRNMHT